MRKCRILQCALYSTQATFLIMKVGGKYPGKYDWALAAINCSNQPIGATRYHFHNFFDDADTIRRKYHTYDHHHKKSVTKG
jgi:hypothetical protein